jgi:8-oxo-dGTP diphosphatase
MGGDRFRLVPAVHLFLVRQREVLLLRRFNTGYEDGNYSVPAGHLDGGESVSAAMVREAWEETGISIDAQDLGIVHVMHRAAAGTGGERVDFFLKATRWRGEPAVMEPDKCDDLSWHSLDALPPNTIPYISSALAAFRSSHAFSEFGWEALREHSLAR